jgi:hypothetical protein
MNVPSFNTDTKDDYKNRVIAYYNSIPSLVIYKNNEDFKIMEDIIKSYKKNWDSFKEEYSLEKYPNLDFELLRKLWKYYEKEFDIDGIKLESDFYKKLTNIKKEFKNKEEKKEKEYKIFKDKKEQKHTEFKYQRYNTFFTLSIKNLSLEYIFNLIECNDNIPYCCFNGIFKIKKNYEPNLKWKESFTNKIILKIKFNNDFIDSFIFIDNDNIKFDIIIDLETNIDIKSYIKSIFKINFEFIEESNEHNIYGIYIFKNQKFNKYILSDIIMNNQVISKFLSVDESIKASTKKSGLLTKFKNFSCNIICKKVLKNDPKIKEYELKIDSHYIQLRLSNFDNLKNINLFISLFSKILTIYNEEKDNLVKIYKEYLSDFNIDEDEDKYENEINEELPSNIFISNYTRSCEAKRHPTIIYEDEIESENLKENQDYIKFPKDEENISKFYRCKKNENYPYIGLLHNTKLKDTYEYLPCCYKEKNKNIQEYYFDIKNQNKKQQNIIKTFDRFLEKDYYGLIPTNLNNFLLSLYNDKEYSFYRKGVSITNRSFLDCILEATGKKIIPIKNFEIASQENPDLSLEQMEEIFNDDKLYLDPKRWITLFEYNYDCNIFLFKRYDKYNAEILLPYFSPPYLKYKNNYKKNIIILENKNSHTGEFRCELICLKLKDKYILNFPNKINDHLCQFYFKLNKKPIIKYSNFPDIKKYNIVSQILDSNKKTRCLITKDNIKLLCDPLPPLDLKIVETDDYENEYENVKKFLKTSKLNSEIKYDMFTIKIRSEEKNKDLLIYQNNKKIACILGELFLFLFSKYSHKNEKDIKNIETVKNFIDENVIIKKTSYSIIQDSLINIEMIKKSGYLSKDNKILINDNETLKRLICLLRLELVNNINKIKTYYTKIEFYNFYKDIEDYNSYKNNIIEYTKNINILKNFENIIYFSFQYLDKYYLKIKKNIFLCESIYNDDDDDDDNDNYIENMNKENNYIIYNDKLDIIKKNNKKKDLTKIYIQYILDKEKKYQILTLLF